jgi:hypothetical protein
VLTMACGAGAPGLTQDCQALLGTVGVKVIICNPADPEAKSLLERAHDSLEPAAGRSFPATTQCAGQRRDGQSPGWHGPTRSVKLLLPSATRGLSRGGAVCSCQVTTRGVDLRSAYGADSEETPPARGHGGRSWPCQSVSN